MNAPQRTAATASEAAAGRMCPFDYRYRPAVFARPPDFEAGTLYVVGGLYGNAAALDEIERMAAAERRPVTLVFNGDFHWFDADAAWFAGIERRIAPHRALRGNVETEIARPDDIGAGCGCAYPDTVSGETVRWSNEIIAALRAVARAHAGIAERLAALPMHLVARVGALRIGIVHGDAWSLAGWRFAHDMLDDPARAQDIARLRAQSGIDMFASTHTCLAALRRLETPDGPLTIVNNGAAGMPNFSGQTTGLITRIATTPSPHRPLYGMAQADVSCDALPVHYDNTAFLARFLARWPQGSPAHASYFARIGNGPAYAIAQARGTAR